MKTDIHPKYSLCEVSCACGNAFTTRSTRAPIKVEICYACHPFYTGKHKFLDTAGRVEKFQKKFAATGGKTLERKPKKVVAAKIAMAPKHRGKKVLSSAPKKAADAKTAKPAKAEKKPAEGK
ncbi:MAG TPA: 50S ribosomal protein L31 [Elusimicrobia bacterium]|nr:50S ribosomal protein L31 [Elusimicrobiota bacterium]